jgi:iron complex outermembrane receptor protein
MTGHLHLRGQSISNRAITINFRLWSRKSYSVYNSLRKLIRICTLSLAYSIIVMPGNLNAQDHDDSLEVRHFVIDGVVVTASRTPVEAQKATRIVTVIPGSDIARAPARTINDILRNCAGVDIRQRGPLGAQADISVRGGTYDQTLVLLNGVNITDPQTGHHNLDLPVDIESIERIEIINGPAAKSFGPGAFNGVINIITGNGKPNNIRASGLLGQYGLSGISAGISNNTGHFKQFISYSRMASEGYIRNTDYSGSTLFCQAEYTLKSGSIDLQAGYGSKDFGANSFYSLKYPDQFESVKTEFASLKYQNRSVIKVVPSLYIRRKRDRFELIRDDTSVPFNHHMTTTAGFNLNIWTVYRLGKTSLGIDLRNEHIISNVLGEPASNPRVVPGFDGTFYSRSFNRLNTSIYAEQSVSLDKITAIVGAMAHYNPEINSFGFYPGMDLSYRLNDHLKLFSSANKTLRMPTFTDMFYRSPVQSGNPSLKPEEAVTVEAGVKYSGTVIKGQVSTFMRRGYNLIDWIKDPSPDSLVWRSQNHANISISGTEFSLTLTPPEESPAGRIGSLTVSWTYLLSDQGKSGMLSKYALDYLRHQVIVTLDFRIVSGMYGSATVTYRERNGVYQDAAGRIVAYDPFWLSDTRLSWKGKNVTFFVEASNVFDTEYYDHGGLVQPGAWVRGGMTVSVDYRKGKDPESQQQSDN